jgi:hypothetical protein
MKKLLSFNFYCFALAAVFMPTAVCAQKQTFDLVIYSAPAGWQKDVTANAISYTTVNKNNNTWCRINIVKSTGSKGSINQDFESEWQELIVKSYQPAEAPKPAAAKETRNWKTKAGAASFIFNGADAMVILTTMSGYDRCVSIVATTNSKDYIKNIDELLASVDMVTPNTNSAPVTANNTGNTSILGTWCNSASDQSAYAVNNGINGYIARQYTFNSNGTYTFYIRTFQYVSNQLLLTRENGTYQVSGNNIIISPQKSTIEAWSKKNGVDDWGKLLKTQNKTIEKKAYQFTKHYFSGIKEWNLVLQADAPTQRDGPFNGGTAFNNAWIYSPVSASHPLIKLPD